MTVVVLAGGQATRLPGKLARPIGAENEPLVVRVVRQLTASGRPCLISVREPLPSDLAARIAAPVAVDRYQDAGPLGGLASATAQVQTPLTFAAAGDLANIDTTAIDELIERYESERARGESVDAVVPRHSSGQLEPLAALYDTKVLHDNAVRTLASGNKKVTGALHGMHIAYYDIAPDRVVLYHNVNTAADLSGVIAR